MFILVHVPQMTVLRNKYILLSYFSDSIDINQRQIKTSAKRGLLNHVVLNGGDQSLAKNIPLYLNKFLGIKSPHPIPFAGSTYVYIFVLYIKKNMFESGIKHHNLGWVTSYFYAKICSLFCF